MTKPIETPRAVRHRTLAAAFGRPAETFDPRHVDEGDVPALADAPLAAVADADAPRPAREPVDTLVAMRRARQAARDARTAADHPPAQTSVAARAALEEAAERAETAADEAEAAHLANEHEWATHRLVARAKAEVPERARQAAIRASIAEGGDGSGAAPVVSPRSARRAAREAGNGKVT